MVVLVFSVCQRDARAPQRQVIAAPCEPVRVGHHLESLRRVERLVLPCQVHDARAWRGRLDALASQRTYQGFQN